MDQKIVDAVKFKYYLSDDEIIFTAVNPKDSSQFQMPLKFSINKNIMIWNMNDFMELKLIKKD